MKNGKRWAVVVLFAEAMAWVESAVVFYLRTMIDRIEPYQPVSQAYQQISNRTTAKQSEL